MSILLYQLTLKLSIYLYRFPDVDFFRDPAVQNQMTDVLFIYCKLNNDVSYRQGMHELLAPIFLVLNNESLDMGDGFIVGPTEYV